MKTDEIKKMFTITQVVNKYINLSKEDFAEKTRTELLKSGIGVYDFLHYFHELYHTVTEEKC